VSLGFEQGVVFADLRASVVGRFGKHLVVQRQRTPGLTQGHERIGHRTQGVVGQRQLARDKGVNGGTIGNQRGGVKGRQSVRKAGSKSPIVTAGVLPCLGQ